MRCRSMHRPPPPPLCRLLACLQGKKTPTLKSLTWLNVLGNHDIVAKGERPDSHGHCALAQAGRVIRDYSVPSTGPCICGGRGSCDVT